MIPSVLRFSRRTRTYGRIIPDLADHIEVAELLTPIDYEERLLMPGGAIYDINMDLSASAVFRPSSKSKSIEGLYLVGASAHPGGGVLMVIGSGLSGARLIEEHE